MSSLLKNPCQLMGCQLWQRLSGLLPSRHSLVQAVPTGLLQWSSGRASCLPSLTHMLHPGCWVRVMQEICSGHSLDYKPSQDITVMHPSGLAMVWPELSSTASFPGIPILPCSVSAKVNHMPFLADHHALLVVLLCKSCHWE